MKNLIDASLRLFLKLLLGLRYRIRVEGLSTIAARGTKGILFLPNHPALIDPVIMGVTLHRLFNPRFLADADQVGQPVVRWLARRLRMLTIKDAAKVGVAGKDEAKAVLQACRQALVDQDNLVVYPAGRVYRSRYEDLRGNSAVERILGPGTRARLVLVRTRGLWGSSFGRASGKPPAMGSALWNGLKSLLANFVFFGPRREISLEFYEPADLPSPAARDRFNRYLEEYYNQAAPANKYVPYTIWEKGGPRDVPEPEVDRIAGDPAGVPASVREPVIAYLVDLAGVAQVQDQDRLAHDLGLDSLAVAELLAWLNGEFGFPPGNVESVQTVGDVLLAACGEGVGPAAETIKPPPTGWKSETLSSTPLQIPAGDRITTVFLAMARRFPDRVITADQTSGGRTYRDIITAVYVLKPEIEAIPGDYVGIMLPASVTADVVFLATLFAGKIPVMVNWTVGPRNLAYSLDLLGVQGLLTAGVLLARLAGQGLDFGPVQDRFITLESVGKGISRWRKLSAFLRSRLGWGGLGRTEVSDTAVVLFTSGSESLPKAVPLTHGNILTNLHDLVQAAPIQESDSLLGMLPPFHSFGLSVGTIFPLCGGVPVVHFPNPTEGATIAGIVEAYQASMLVGTPTFLRGILRGAKEEQLSSLRLVVTGAEKCPKSVYDTVAEQVPGALVLEGYGITECSPVVSVNDFHAPQPGTIGRVMPSLSYVIVDMDNDCPATPGTTGLLLLRGPSIFSGYLKFAGPSPFVTFAGKEWYRTGDLVRDDGTGVLTFCGRLKRFIKLGGEMISLPAIEGELTTAFPAPEVTGPILAVTSTPTEDHPEVVLFTVLDLGREEVNRAIRQAGLSALHNVRRVIKIDEMPLLGTGKTNYRQLQESL